MAYEKHVWQTNEIITADKLNHIEDALEGSGSEGGILIIRTRLSQSQSVTDKTAGEIKAAFYAGKPIWLMQNEGVFRYCIGYMEQTGSRYVINFGEQNGTELVFTAVSEDDYMTSFDLK